jgi:hypothetical protein
MLATIARLVGPGGVRAVAAESLLLQAAVVDHQSLPDAFGTTAIP